VNKAGFLLDNLTQFEEQLASTNRSIRYRAVYRIAKLDDPKAAEMLANVLMNDNDRDIRAATAKLLANYHTADVVTHLKRALKADRHAQVRRACAEALGNMDAERSIDGLLEALNDRSKLVRRAAVQSLCLLNDLDAVPALVGVLLGDPDSYVRWEAAKTLEILYATEAVPALIEALTADDNSYVRYAAAVALGELGDLDVTDPLATAMMRDDNSHVRYAAARALGYFMEETSDPALIRTLLYALEDENTQVWHAAAESLWTSGDIVMPIVIDAFQSRSNRLRKVALKALLWLSAEYDDIDLMGYTEREPYTGWGWWN
jgi:HEAT repeat protein